MQWRGGFESPKVRREPTLRHFTTTQMHLVDQYRFSNRRKAFGLALNTKCIIIITSGSGYIGLAMSCFWFQSRVYLIQQRAYLFKTTPNSSCALHNTPASTFRVDLCASFYIPTSLDITSCPARTFLQQLLIFLSSPAIPQEPTHFGRSNSDAI